MSRWIQEAGAAHGYEIGKNEAREYVYGMAYDTWRTRHQTEATQAQKIAFKAAQHTISVNGESQATKEAGDRERWI